MNKLQSNVLLVEINGKRTASFGLRRRGNGSVFVNLFSIDKKKRRKRPSQSITISALENDARGALCVIDFLNRRTLKVGDVVNISVRKSGPVPRIKPNREMSKWLNEQVAPKRRRKA